MSWTIEAIEAANKAAGLHFFDRDTLKFWGSKVSSTVHEGPGGVYFVTSETAPFNGVRRSTVRKFVPIMGRVLTVGGLGDYGDNAAAHAEAARLARTAPDAAPANA